MLIMVLFGWVGFSSFLFIFFYIFLIQINYICVVFIYKKVNTISFGWSEGVGQGVKQDRKHTKKYIKSISSLYPQLIAKSVIQL